MTNFSELRRKAREVYKAEMDSINHWEKVWKALKKKADKGSVSFTMQFPHGAGYDDESKVKAYAKEFGFSIANEEISLLATTYTFRKE